MSSTASGKGCIQFRPLGVRTPGVVGHGCAALPFHDDLLVAQTGIKRDSAKLPAAFGILDALAQFNLIGVFRVIGDSSGYGLGGIRLNS